MFTLTPTLVTIPLIVYLLLNRNARWWRTGNFTLTLNRMTLVLILLINNTILYLSKKIETNPTNHSCSRTSSVVASKLVIEAVGVGFKSYIGRDCFVLLLFFLRRISSFCNNITRGSSLIYIKNTNNKHHKTLYSVVLYVVRQDICNRGNNYPRLLHSVRKRLNVSNV